MSYESPKYYIGDLYVGIAMNVKKLITIMEPICEYYNKCKKIYNFYGSYMWVLHIWKWFYGIKIK
jgi:hypothetical protein